VSDDTGPSEPAEVRCDLDARGVATVTIDRPTRRNAMSFGVMAELRDVFARLRDDDAARVVVLTGAGEQAFCAGADLGGIADNASPAEVHLARGALADVFRNLDRIGKPTIARVRGYALAGGFGLACACDLVVAADDAVFGTPEVDVGLWPYMITVPLLRSLPPKVVLELMMTGRRVGAAEAERLGFANRVVAPADLDAAVEEYVTTLLAKSPLVLQLGRDAFYRTLDIPDSDDALAYLHAMLSVHTTSADAAEGVAAFAEKRAPRWTGR
jgi:enoyl-CoA hydratase/carnithine racemase